MINVCTRSGQRQSIAKSYQTAVGMPEKVDPLVAKAPVLDVFGQPGERVGVRRCFPGVAAAALIQKVQRAVLPAGIQVAAKRAVVVHRAAVKGVERRP